jgi:4-amino-4-deoxy-L-arabinose transferase-like glycosyltransferase
MPGASPSTDRDTSVRLRWSQMRWVLIVALLPRLAILALDVGHPDRLVNPDTATYLLIAKHLPDALWPTKAELLNATLERPPGYPAILSVAASSVLVGVIFQVLVSLVLVWLVYHISSAILDHQLAMLPALVVALEPVTMSYDFIVVSETMFTLALNAAVAVWLLGMNRPSVLRFVLSGSVFGLATLIRPTTLYLLLILVPVTYFVVRSDKVARALPG